MNHKIIIAGHPYSFPYYFKVFEYAENKDDFIFVLPKLWIAKKGKVRIELKPKPGFKIHGLNVLSYGGHGIRGLLKGYQPGIIFLLPYLKIKYKSRVFYSCSEPNLLTTFLNGVTAKLLGMNYVFFTWQNVGPEKRIKGLKLKISNLLVRMNLKLADGVICGNKKAEGIIKKFNPKIKTIISPLSGVDTEKFKPTLIDKLDRKRTILFYGALEKRKGLNYLLRAFERINDRKVKLVIVGTGPEKEKLQQLSQELKVNDRIFFLDWMKNEELPQLLNSADVFVYPSISYNGWEEQFGYAMAEASASGVPVVGTKTGSIGEVVIDGKSGVLVESNNFEELANALNKLLTDAKLAEEMGKYGRKYIVDNFSHKIIAKKISDFLYNFL